MSLSVSVCIACHNQGHLIREAIESCLIQNYEGIEIVVLMDACTDNTREVVSDLSASLVDNYEELGEKGRWIKPTIKFYASDSPSGTGGSFNKSISKATGDIIVLLCADDIFTDSNVISDIVKEFEKDKKIGHVSRWYYQFIDGDRSPVRAWRDKVVLELANNPSGMAFRRGVINNTSLLTNKMFVEVATPVKEILDAGWNYSILPYDTVAVRIHKSISRTPTYYNKMWKSSPVEEWSRLGWKTNDFTHLIQVGVNFEKEAVTKEFCQFLNLNEWNLFNPVLWLFYLIALWTPKKILYKIPEIYRSTWGKWTTRKIERKNG